MTAAYEPTYEAPVTPEPPKRRRTVRAEPMAETVIGPTLFAHVRMHADQLQGDGPQGADDPRVLEATVNLLRKWAAELEARWEEVQN